MPRDFEQQKELVKSVMRRLPLSLMFLWERLFIILMI